MKGSSGSDTLDILLSKRTDQLLADFQAYVDRIEGHREPPPSTAGDEREDDSAKDNDATGDIEQQQTGGGGKLSAAPPIRADPPEEGQFHPRPDAWRVSQRNLAVRGGLEEAELGERHDGLATGGIYDDKSKDPEVRASSWKFTSDAALATYAALGSVIAIALLGSGSYATTGKDDLSVSKLVYEGIPAPREPTWFDRSSSPVPWTGQTYDEAVQFCASKGEATLCSYDTICPLGPGTRPLGGVFAGEPTNGITWAAASDEPNSWVQVGSKDVCLTYEFMHGKHPPWGLTGEDSEVLTRHVMCCPLVASQDANREDGTTSDSQASAVVQQETAGWMRDMDPLWYDRSDGWSGSTFDEARDFCRTRESRHPCPYEAYCPEGPHHSPVKGGGMTRSADEEDDNGGSIVQTYWSPIVDEIGPGIVQVGGGSSYADDGAAYCKVRYLDSENKLSGEGLESLTTSIMCCRLIG